MSIKNELRQFGFVPPTQISPDNYILGGLTKLPTEVINPTGKWFEYRPIYEPQFGEGWDTFGCTVWGTENAIEILLKKLTGIEYNFSERFIYILGEIRPPGADPHKITEVIRENGLIENDLLPMTASYEEFLTPDPMTSELLVEGQKWPYELKHEWVWKGEQTREERMAKIREAIKYSPLGVSVTAWFEENGVYVDRGLPNSHWCVLLEETDKGWLIFDSYDQATKVISFDHNIKFAKRYYLAPKLPPRNWLVDLLKRLFSIL